ncbi:hypothetical protein PT974_06437 [Cladobotryum mycophilum]|uniref:Fungal N-terminal domain-containing protein n=1 Tax=Cladobotryum mycophilum TaxID=491253 RepID=A0ABR0SLG0_9HYPO
MSSPLLMSNAVFLAKAALKIGQAFTKGRKSAPAEFREVESQLYALSGALSALAKARETEGSSPLLVDPATMPKHVPAQFDGNQDIILGMVNSCKETLEHLEKIVERYSVLAPGAKPDKARMKRWKPDLTSDWRKITWTTEGGDLTALKNSLTTQTNSLNLILGVVINSQTDRLRNDVGHMSKMLVDIHEWFEKNLRDATSIGTAPVRSFTAATSVNGEPSFMGEAHAPSVELYFELYEQIGTKSRLVCPKACLDEKVSGAYYSTSIKTNQLFNCVCNTSNHRPAVESYGLSPMSYATRIAGSERSWLLYKVANRVTDQLVALVVKGVPPDAMYDFEELLVHGLSVIQTRQMLRRRMSTMLAHASDADTECPKANLLDIVSNATTVQTSVTTIKFTSGGVSYFRDSIELVQMLHYKSINLDRIMDDVALPQTAFDQHRQAEVVIVYRKQENGRSDDIVRTILHLKWNSEVELKPHDDVVAVKNIDCTGYDASETRHPTMSATVTFDFVGRGAAIQFQKELEAIRMELFIIHLQHPRVEEKALFKLQAENVDTERMHINDAEITILQNTTTKRFRLIIQSRNGYSTLSQDLAEDFFSRMSTQGRPDFGTLSYEVYMDGTGKRCVRKCPNGFAHLVFSDGRIDRVFAIGLEAIGGRQSDHSCRRHRSR